MKNTVGRSCSGLPGALLVAATVFAITLSGAVQASDRGANRPGAAGNNGAHRVHADPGVNQPGAVGNVGAPGVHVDPGVNQPGAIGNVGVPGVHVDPGVNQPGVVGNRRIY